MLPTGTPHRDPRSLPAEPLQVAKFPPDDADLPDVPPDLPPDIPDGGGGGGYGDDAGDIRRIKSGTSWMGRITGVLFIVGAVVLGWIYWQQYQHEQHKLDVWNRAQAAATRDDESVSLREQRVADHVCAQRLRTEARHQRRDLA